MSREVSIFLGLLLYFISKDENALTSKTYFYVFTAIIPLIGVFIFALNKGSFLSDPYNKSIFIGIVVSSIVIGLIFYLYTF